MKNKVNIIEAVNVYTPAYLTLIDKGFEVTKRSLSREEEEWSARKDEMSFKADSPLSLLGLIAMYESRGTDWQADDDSIDDFMKIADW